MWEEAVKNLTIKIDSCQGRCLFHYLYQVISCGIEIFLEYILQYPMIGIISRGANIVFHYGHIALAFVLFAGLIMFIHRSLNSLKNHSILDVTDKYSYDAYLVHFLCWDFIRPSKAELIHWIQCARV